MTGGPASDSAAPAAGSSPLEVYGLIGDTHSAALVCRNGSLDWEVRGPRRHFTHSKVMAWVAADRAVRAVEESGLDGEAERWRRLRADIHEEVCREGYDAARGTFTQSYGCSFHDPPPASARRRRAARTFRHPVVPAGQTPMTQAGRRGARRRPAFPRGYGDA